MTTVILSFRTSKVVIPLNSSCQSHCFAPLPLLIARSFHQSARRPTTRARGAMDFALNGAAGFSSVSRSSLPIRETIVSRVPLIPKLAGTNSIGHQSSLKPAVLVSPATSDYMPTNGTKCSAHGALTITERGRGAVPS